MEHHEPSTLLAAAETIHWIALAIMAIVYIVRLMWLLQFRDARDRQPAGQPDKTNGTKGGLYSLGNVLMPWAMESTRDGLPFYATFLVFHLGVVAGIGLAFVSSLYRPAVEIPVVGVTTFAILTAAFLIGLYRIVRRLTLPHLKLISSPDDYFSVIMLTGWFLSAMLAQAYFLGWLQSELFLVAFLLATSFFLIYVPFSKISHYLYYPFTRYWLGRTLGHRGSMPYARGVKEANLSEQATSHKVEKILEQLPKKLTRQVVGSLVGCVHCGMCHDACHYALAFPDDPKMTPSYKADQLRKIFKQHHDWTGRVFPKWVKASTPVTDEDLEELKDIAFGTCTNCRRCTYNCPMGVDTATLNRIMRGLLTRVGVMPEGVRVVSKDQWEIGNQMGVLKEDYLDTLEWMSEELEEQLGHDRAKIPVDKRGAKVMYTINPREAKYDPRTIKAAALIFYAAGEDWTMPSDGWDQTNFGLFSGDDQLGGVCGKRVYEKLEELDSKELVISECGHGYRSTRCEAPNWAGVDVKFTMESSVMTMLRYVKEGRIKVDKTRNTDRVTFHDSCNNARSCGFYEEPRELLELVVSDFQEMYPNRTENYCCTGGGGAMSMSEYTPRRLQSAQVKADQIKATGAKIVVTSCHNCVDGLGDLIKHYKLDCEVKQLVDLVAEALVLDELEKPEAVAAPEEVAAPAPAPVEVAEPKPEPALALTGRRILVVDDEEDVRIFLSTVLEDAGAEVLQASDGDEAIAVMTKERPDLVTLDLSMPGKDGVETFAEMRKHPEVKEIPVCVVTGHPEFRKVIYDRAVPPPEGYMDKPVDEEELVSNLKRILDLREKKTRE